MDKLPRQGSREPWRIHQNYVQDIFALRFAAVDDGVLEFSARPALVADQQSRAMAGD